MKVYKKMINLKISFITLCFVNVAHAHSSFIENRWFTDPEERIKYGPQFSKYCLTSWPGSTYKPNYETTCTCISVGQADCQRDIPSGSDGPSHTNVPKPSRPRPTKIPITKPSLSSTTTNRTPSIPTDEFRLPLSIVPVNYKLEVMTILDPTPGYERFTAPSKIWITVLCKEHTSIVTLHTFNLTINHESIRITNTVSEKNQEITGISFDKENEIFHIQLTKTLRRSKRYEIYIEFVTPMLTNSLVGLYTDFYDDTTGKRYLASTKFEPNYARRAFPCFDEPALKATFDLTIGHHKKYHAMSNTEIIETKPIKNLPNWQWDTFGTTPIMASYIFAMTVSDLAYQRAPRGSFRNVIVRVYANPELIQKGAAIYSAKLTGRVMTYFESLFVLKYPMSKFYSVALQNFVSGAMENWGLITYLENLVLYLRSENTEKERYGVTFSISHENSHQHFGNLVTCKWWSYLWLNEGFATYLAHYGINYTNPELLPWEQFIPTILQVAMEFDSSNATHPLKNPISSTSEIAGIYTHINYEKGACILRMASSIVTESVFLDGLRLYLDRHQYSNVEQNDLFQALQESADSSALISSLLPTSVHDILETWTVQVGFPVLAVKIVNSDALEISQEKFIDGDITSPSTTWWVPVYLTPRPNRDLPENFPDLWIPHLVTNVVVNIRTDQLIIVNPGSIGYYRVLYDDELLRKILSQLNTNHTQISNSARSQILNDYFHFAINGYSTIETVLSLTEYLDQEMDLSVWQGVLPLIEKLSKLLLHTQFEDDFKIYFSTKSWNAFKLLEKLRQSSSDKGARAILRSSLMKLACSLDNLECIKTSKNIIRDWMISPINNLVPVEIQEAVYCTGASLNSSELDSDFWTFLFSQYVKIQQSVSFSPNRTRLVKSLSCSKSRTNIKTLFGMITSKSSGMKVSEKRDVLSKLADSSIGKDLIMESFQDSSIEILNSIYISDKELNGFFEILTSHMLSKQDFIILEAIAEQLPSGSEIILKNNLKKSLKSKKWLTRILQPLGAWLNIKLRQ